MNEMEKRHWLYRGENLKKIWIGGSVILLLTVIAELLVKLHPYFKIAEIFAFHAIYGLLSCVAMILFARLLGFFIKRRDDYYDR